jgi:hypothetical protein
MLLRRLKVLMPRQEEEALVEGLFHVLILLAMVVSDFSQVLRAPISTMPGVVVAESALLRGDLEEEEEAEIRLDFPDCQIPAVVAALAEVNSVLSAAPAAPASSSCAMQYDHD